MVTLGEFRDRWGTLEKVQDGSGETRKDSGRVG